MTLSQLTPLFPGLDLPAILDLLFLKTSGRPRHATYQLRLWPQEPVFYYFSH